MPSLKSESSSSNSASIILRERVAAAGRMHSDRRNRDPVWLGPESKGRQGGITQGLLQRYLCCPERFRVHAIDGLRAGEGFSHKLEYGNMFHLCEEYSLRGLPDDMIFRGPLQKYVADLERKHPMHREEIEKWYMVCCCQYPIYRKYWLEHPDQRARESLVQEYVFSVPYRLPSGRIVFLRGKWDDVTIIRDVGRGDSMWCVDHKTKGELDAKKIAHQLTFDIQTMTYIVALEEERRRRTSGDGVTTMRTQVAWLPPIRGVFYNCIRRPLSGGRHTIIPHKEKVTKKNRTPAESSESFYGRLAERIAGDPEYFFVRFPVELGTGDLVKFRREFLDPVLENVCDDYEWWSQVKRENVFDYTERAKKFPHHRLRHWRTPFGVYNALMDRNAKESDVDEYLRTGDRGGLSDVTDLFPELKVA